MNRHYLMFDLGTGNSRVLLVTSEGEILGSRSLQNIYQRDALYRDAQYFLPSEWWRGLEKCVDELMAEFPDVWVDVVSAAGARQTLVLFDEDGKDFYALPNIDNRGREFMREITDRAEIYRRSGKWVTQDFCAAKLMGLRKKRPELYGRIASFTSISEWIAAHMTGQIVIEPSQAGETQLYNIREKTWSQTLCRQYGVDRLLLPTLVNAGEVVGGILPKWQKKWHMAQNAVFIMGGADTQTAVMQTGVKTGEIAIISGTTSPVVAKIDEVMYDAWERVWVDIDLGAEAYLVEMNPGVTGLNYQRFKNQFFPDVSYVELEESYARKKSFACTASFSSLLFYKKTSLRNGGFFMRAPLQDNVDRFDMIWAVLADTACSTYEQYDQLGKLTKSEPDVIRGCGGGFQSRELCRMLGALAGKDICLEDGYEQATTGGLLELCNRHFGEKRLRKKQPVIVRTQEYPLIHEYYEEWMQNRDSVNHTDLM